jgi:hypothetical protein
MTQFSSHKETEQKKRVDCGGRSHALAVRFLHYPQVASRAPNGHKPPFSADPASNTFAQSGCGQRVTVRSRGSFRRRKSFGGDLPNSAGACGRKPLVYTPA